MCGWCRAFVVFICLLLGASSSPARVQGSDASSRSYTIGSGDVLKVEAFQHEEISGQFQVEEDGTITFPLLDAVVVGGLSTAEIARRLEGLLERDYYVDVQLQVEVSEYRSQPVTVQGEVGSAGTYHLEGPTSLVQILAEAGGLRSTAGPVVELRRVVVDEEGVEASTVWSFPTSKVMSGELGGDVRLKVGDVVSVSAKQLYFVTGEAARPGQYEIAPGMTLMQAVSQAGGQGKFASSNVELHREVEGEKQILKLDLSRIQKGKDEDPEIRAGDVIILKRRFF